MMAFKVVSLRWLMVMFLRAGTGLFQTLEPLVSSLHITVSSSHKAIKKTEKRTLREVGVVLVINDLSRPIFTGLPLTLRCGS